MEFQSPAFFLRLVGAISRLLPGKFRSDWRREWEAEIISRWMLLEKWERLTLQTKFDLLKRVRGALFDVLWFQQRRTQSLLVTLNMLVAALITYGAGQEFIVSGILLGRTQPFLISLAGIFVGFLFMISGIAMLRRWSSARRLIIGTGMLSILVHVYGSLPSHRSMGYPALLVGAGYGLFMLLGFEWNRRRSLVS